MEGNSARSWNYTVRNGYGNDMSLPSLEQYAGSFYPV